MRFGVVELLHVHQDQIAGSTCEVETENAIVPPLVVQDTFGDGAKPGRPSHAPE